MSGQENEWCICDFCNRDEGEKVRILDFVLHRECAKNIMLVLENAESLGLEQSSAIPASGNKH
jgi:hypothetical protein